MIVTKKKNFQDLTKMIKSRSVYVIGCSQCATLCKTGGEHEVLQMKEQLEDNGYTVTGFFVLDPACHQKNSKRLFRQELSKIDCASSLLVLACGSGVQNVSTLFPEKHIVSGTDTLFLGVEEIRGIFSQKCSLCGTCIVENYSGVCPIGQCPKHMLNGPCGGSMDGRCEVSKEYFCVWEKILEKMKNGVKEHQLKHIIPPHNWSVPLIQQVADDSR